MILVDEAGQVDTADVLKLQATADQAGARIVPVGDEFQLGAINAGGMFPLLADRLGAVEIHEVHRFAEQWEKDASLRLRHGDLTVIADYQARGRVHAGREDQARRDMVLDWAAAIRAGLDALMIAQSEAEVTELNRRAAEHMARARKAAGWRPGVERVRLSDGNLAQAGDWIQARLNDRLITTAGQWLANRDILQITRIYGHGPDRQIEARRRLPDGTWTAKFTLPARYAEKSATLGYASTIYAAQGRTVDAAFGLVTQGMNREALYVAATRGRQENRLHVVTGPEQSDQQAAPETVLAQALSTPAAEQSATAELAAAMDDNDHPARLLYLYDEIIAPERSAGSMRNSRHGSTPPTTPGTCATRPVRCCTAPCGRRSSPGTTPPPCSTRSPAGPWTGHAVSPRSCTAACTSSHCRSSIHPWRGPTGCPKPGPKAPRGKPPDDGRPHPGDRRAAGRPARTVAGRPARYAATAARTSRDDWISRAGRAGFYRQAHGITDPDVALGPRPDGNPGTADRMGSGRMGP